jgi:hypothetical protein
LLEKGIIPFDGIVGAAGFAGSVVNVAKYCPVVLVEP